MGSWRRSKSTVDEADRPFAVERIYAMEPGGAPIDIAASARMLPMLGNRRIVTVLRAEKLLKPKRATKAEASDVADEPGHDEGESVGDLTPLEDYVNSPVDSTTVVFVASEVDRSRRFTKKLLERAQVAELTGFITEGRPEPAASTIGPLRGVKRRRSFRPRGGRLTRPGCQRWSTRPAMTSTSCGTTSGSWCSSPPPARG